MPLESPLKKFLGTGNYLAKLTFYPNRKYYSSALKVKVEIFDGRNVDRQFNCESISEVGSKITAFYQEKTGMELEIRRLARWFIEYLESVGITPPDLNDLMRDLESSPQEQEARGSK